MVSAEIPVNTINRQLSARKYGTEGLEEFMKKKSTLSNTNQKKKETEKGNIRRQRRPSFSWIMY